MLYESVDQESLECDKSLAGVEVVSEASLASGSTGPKLAPRIGEGCGAVTLNVGVTETESPGHDHAGELPGWLVDAVQRWHEWPQWKRAAVRALVEAHDG